MGRVYYSSLGELRRRTCSRIPVLPLSFALACIAAATLSAGASAAFSRKQATRTEADEKTFVEMSPAELAKRVHGLKQLYPAESQDALPQILEWSGRPWRSSSITFPIQLAASR